MKLTALCFLSAAEARVRLSYQHYQVRNANSPTDNGRCVFGACGGVDAYGANGVGTITDGDTITLNVNYCAGHASPHNAFRMAYSCNNTQGTTQAGLEAAESVLTAATDNCTATGGTGPYTDNGVDGGVPASNGIVTGGYTVTCNLPPQHNSAPLACTAALIDQRDWGGCVDLSVLPAAVPAPPALPPAPVIAFDTVAVDAVYLKDSRFAYNLCIVFKAEGDLAALLSLSGQATLNDLHFSVSNYASFGASRPWGPMLLHIRGVEPGADQSAAASSDGYCVNVDSEWGDTNTILGGWYTYLTGVSAESPILQFYSR